MSKGDSKIARSLPECRPKPFVIPSAVEESLTASLRLTRSLETADPRGAASNLSNSDRFLDCARNDRGGVCPGNASVDHDDCAHRNLGEELASSVARKANAAM